jgi:hypothetical protein
MRSSDRTRRRVRATLVILALVAAGAVTLTPPQVEGEHGLWVRLVGDSVVVHWLTADSVPGSLIATTAAEVRRFTTTPARAHRAAFRAHPNAAVTLRYGSRTAPHETRIRIPDGTRDPVTLPAVDSLFVVGDTHGDFDALVSGLRTAGLIDDDSNWTGGRSRLVLAGDLTDRGPDVLRLLWFVYRLEHEAAEAGGGVHVLLGNHEIMVMLSDLRYVHPKELDVARRHGVGYHRLFDVRESLLGRWLATKPAVIRMGDVLITHGGIAHEIVRRPIQEFDDTLAGYINEELFYRWADSTYMPALDSAAYEARHAFFWGARSVFWHREYVLTDTLAAELDLVLNAWDASVLVVGHTAVPQIHARYDGRLVPVHTSRFGAELLLFTRTRAGLQRHRIIAGQPTESF